MNSIAPRVLVTRPAAGGSALADELRALGADPVLVPAIELVEPTSFALLDTALAELAHFHWLLFTSANAVEAFSRRRLQVAEPLNAERTSAASPQSTSGPKIAAIGPATARALQAIGLEPHLLPPQAVAESLTEALLPFARQLDGTPTRFLLVRAEEARELLPETLRSAGAEVTVAPAYRTVIPASSVTLLRDLLTDPKAPEAPLRDPHALVRNTGGSAEALPSLLAAITFTSASAVRNLLTLAEAAAVHLPESARRVSIGPVTSAALREFGLPPHAEAPEATVASLAATVMRTLAHDQAANT